jgi:hypothetical protein
MKHLDSPLGPFERHPTPVLEHPTEQFPLEDPYVWHGGRRFHAILKDFKGSYTGAGPSLALFEPPDGLAWQPAAHRLVSTLQIEWEDGEVQPVKHLERPQLHLENGVPRALLCACDVNEWRSASFNVQMPLGE